MSIESPISHTVSNQIHHTANIGPEVILGTGNVIGPNVILEGKISVGNGNHFFSGCHIMHFAEIGDHNQFYSNTQIGAAGEMGRKGDKLIENCGVRIGHRNQFRENVVIHSPYYYQETIIGNDNYIMNGAYIAHDVRIGNNCILNAHVALGGRVHLGDYVTVGMQAAVHQRMYIGDFAMVGMLTPIVKCILPGVVVAGNPARIRRMNTPLFEQLGWESSDIDAIQSFVESEGKVKLSSSHPLYSAWLLLLKSEQQILWKQARDNNETTTQ